MELERTVNRLFQQVILCISLSLISLVVVADIRVLVRFDESGHFVHSLTEAPTQKVLRKTAPDSTVISARSTQLTHVLSPSDRIEAARALLRDETATLLWFDASGIWLSNTEEPDPRVTRAPSHIDGDSKSHTGLNHGACR